MKYLSQFFDTKAFFKDKVLTVLKPDLENFKYNEHNEKTSEIVGFKTEVAISLDKTRYKDGSTDENIFEKFYIKHSQKLELRRGQKIKIKDANCVIYGTFNNNLSVELLEFEVLNDK